MFTIFPNNKYIWISTRYIFRWCTWCR